MGLLSTLHGPEYQLMPSSSSDVSCPRPHYTVPSTSIRVWGTRGEAALGEGCGSPEYTRRSVLSEGCGFNSPDPTDLAWPTDSDELLG